MLPKIKKMTLKKYIKNKKSNHFVVSGIQVFVKDEITTGFDPKEVVQSLTLAVPSHLLRNLEIIYIGHIF